MPSRTDARKSGTGASADVEILWIESRQMPQHQGSVGHRTSEGPGLVERARKRDDSPTRTSAIRGFETDHAAERCWLADGPTRIRAEGHGCGMRCDSSRRTAGASTRNEPWASGRTPRIPHRAVATRLVGGSHRELVHVGLAQQDGSRIPEICRHCRLVRGNETSEDPRTRGSRYTLRTKDVLDGNRDAFERAGLVTPEPFVRPFGGGPGNIRRIHDDGIEIRHILLRSEVGLGEFDGGAVTGSQPRRRLRHPELREFRHLNHSMTRGTT